MSEAVADAVAQGINLATGRQESWNWEQTSTSFGMGMITGYSQTRGAIKSNAQKNAGNNIYPTNDGFDGKPKNVTLREGRSIDRYGSADGRFVTDVGTPAKKLSLPPDKLGMEPNTYIILKDIENVNSGKALPWFGQSGGGQQYLLPKSINQLMEEGFLKLWQNF